MARLRHAALEAAQRGAALAPGRPPARGRRVHGLSRATSAVRCRHARRRPDAAVRRPPRADARPKRHGRSRRCNGSCGTSASATRGSPASFRPRGGSRRRRLPRADLLAGDTRIEIAADDEPGARNRRRSLRLLPFGRAPPFSSRRRRRRQGSRGEHFHGREQGAVQERDIARAGCRHRPADVRCQRRGFARQPARCFS